MRIYDGDSDRTLGSIDLFLTHDDIEELMTVLRELQSAEVGGQYQVIEPEPASPEYIHEISVALYEEGDVPVGWAERAAEVVLEDQ